MLGGFSTTIAVESGDSDEEYRGYHRPSRVAIEHDCDGEADIRGHSSVGVHVRDYRALVFNVQEIFTEKNRRDVVVGDFIGHFELEIADDHGVGSKNRCHVSAIHRGERYQRVSRKTISSEIAQFERNERVSISFRGYETVQVSFRRSRRRGD